jgi:transposase InsO family protein
MRPRARSRSSRILDDHSRLLVGATARTVFKAGDVVADLHAAIARHGRPERLLTDNGAVFTGHYRGPAGSRWNANSSPWASA